MKQMAVGLAVPTGLAKVCFLIGRRRPTEVQKRWAHTASLSYLDVTSDRQDPRVRVNVTCCYRAYWLRYAANSVLILGDSMWLMRRRWLGRRPKLSAKFFQRKALFLCADNRHIFVATNMPLVS